VQEGQQLLADRVSATPHATPNRTICTESTIQRQTPNPINIRRSDFLPERWKRLRTMVDKVERTVSEYAWLCIKRAHVQRPLFGMCGYRGDLCRPAHSAVSASRAWSPGGRPLPRRLGRLVDFGFASRPLSRNNDRIGSELRAARADLGVLGGSQPSRCCGSQKWEPTCSDVPRRSAM
jgi:hypothetical protein